MIGAGSYLLSAAALTALLASLAFSAIRLRRRLIPEWEGAPARLVEAITGIALLIWISELLGVLSLLYAWTLVVSSLLVAGAIAWWSRPSAAVRPCRRMLPGVARVEGGRERTQLGPPAGPPPPVTGPPARHPPARTPCPCWS